MLSLTGLTLACLCCIGEAQEEVVLGDWLTLDRVGYSGRSAIHVDALEAQIVAGTWAAPQEGDTLTVPGGEERSWQKATVDGDGWLTGRAMRGGYAYASVEREAAGVMVLEAAGQSVAYVNGIPRVGDPYGYGWGMIPVALRRGANDVLLQGARGRVRAKLVHPEGPAFLNTRDLTLPDLIAGEPTDTWAAVIVVNATQNPLTDAALVAHVPGGRPVRTSLPGILPLGTRKVGFRLRGPAPTNGEEVGVEVQLLCEGRCVDTETIKLRVREPYQTRKHTFISEIDGSVQYYAVNPMRSAEPVELPALFLSTHGAGVEAIGQADAYAPKHWGHLVAPTNRRPYGFDWEDWGRLDAMEVLSLAQERLGTDPTRTYLTGHSMGGHGAWHLAVTYPDKWAAVGPSAAWISFSSYGRGRGGAEEPTPVEQMLRRASSPSDTLNRVRNTLHHGVYILHGEKDDNVPVSHAHRMNEALTEFHRDFAFHEEPGAGHWWDNSDEPGAACVDWPPMFDLFARHQIPNASEVRQIEFTTPSPAVSASSHWVTIEAQQQQLVPSTVKLRCDPWKRRFVGTTENVLCMSLSLEHLQPGEDVHVELDGQKLRYVDWPEDEPRLWIERAGDAWAQTERPSPGAKGPHRAGLFKEAFRNRMLFVYGTQGTDQENAWALAKARYDAETFWYRGNGSIDVLPDTAFDPAIEPDRNVILYGNADTNGAWEPLLSLSPVQVHRGQIDASERQFAGDDLACLFVQPRPGSDVASVGVVAGTGIAGLRLTDRLSYFVSGAAFPDLLVIAPNMLTEGAEGLLAAGFFGQDWSVDGGEFAWAEGRRQ